uniref:Uncharacterized protein n=1 Tax=Anopheles dirus TaxID=7168 RepID=A0A182NXR5_9DIPT
MLESAPIASLLFRTQKCPITARLHIMVRALKCAEYLD